ncbi:MAG TPA: hypothetical protein VGP77_10690 [Vicinamibacterales bacterium]|jgi:hypothetical protein|nr:hypothetical protein [Vicinamibacterales bacterium]
MHRWLILLIALSYVPLGPVSAQTDETEAAATREVYVTVLGDPRLTGRTAQKPDVLVTRHSDDPSWLWTVPDLPPEARASLAQRLPDIPQSLVERLLERLADERPLPDDLPTRQAVTFVEESELKSMFGSGGDGWQRFYKQHPRAPGFVSLSRIAFDPEYSQALLFVNHTYGLLGAKGYFVLLRRASNGWAIERIRLFYVS